MGSGDTSSSILNGGGSGIGVFNGSQSLTNGTNSLNGLTPYINNNGVADANQGTRETGIIEKLLVSFALLFC